MIMQDQNLYTFKQTQYDYGRLTF